MKLYITPGSPYARIARIVIIEKGLEDRVETVLAQTRTIDSPYYRINPSGRVPYLIRDDDVGLEESTLICRHLDELDGKPRFADPVGDAGSEARRLAALARSLLDGLSVWVRETARPANERSAAVIQHETARGSRMIDLWENAIDHPQMHGALSLAQITLGCALGLEVRNPDFHWRGGHGKLCAWYDRIAARASFTATVPPAGH